MEDFVQMEARGATTRKASRIALAGGIVLLLTIPLLLAFLAQAPDLHTIDYVSVWAGAQIIGPNLYDSARLERIEHTVSPLIESKRYIRPPYYVMMFWPLGGLPYRAAYAGFVLMNLAALLLFLRIWRFEIAAILACALFLPLEWSFGLGQDAPIMMAIVAGAAQLIQRRRDFAGGALLALFTVKPHLFLFLPVVLIAQRKYRALAGLAVGGAALYLLAAVFVGIDWPLKSMAAALSNEATFVPSTPGVAGLLRKLHAPGWLLLPAVIAGIAMVYQPRPDYRLAPGRGAGHRGRRGVRAACPGVRRQLLSAVASTSGHDSRAGGNRGRGRDRRRHACRNSGSTGGNRHLPGRLAPIAPTADRDIRHFRTCRRRGTIARTSLTYSSRAG